MRKITHFILIKCVKILGIIHWLEKYTSKNIYTIWENIESFFWAANHRIRASLYKISTNFGHFPLFPIDVTNFNCPEKSPFPSLSHI